MKNLLVLLALLFGCQSLFAQDKPAEEDEETFYLGLSFGRSFSLGNFRDKSADNSDAGFADHGFKFDVYGGYFLTDKITLTGQFRYQSFPTDVSEVVEAYEAANPGVDVSASSENWQTYSLLFGAAYKGRIVKNFALYPRVGLGPMFVSNPEITSTITNGNGTQRLSRSSETELGLGYEVGVGLRNDFGRRISLMPTFVVSGGFVSIADVETNTNGDTEVRDYSPRILSFNIGISLAYRFY